MKADTGIVALYAVGALLIYGIYESMRRKPAAAAPATPPTAPIAYADYTINWDTPASRGVVITIFGGSVPPGTTVQSLAGEGWTLEARKLYEPDHKQYLDLIYRGGAAGEPVQGIPGTVMTATATKSIQQNLNAAAAPYPTKYYEKAGGTPLVGIDIY